MLANNNTIHLLQAAFDRLTKLLTEKPDVLLNLLESIDTPESDLKNSTGLSENKELPFSHEFLHSGQKKKQRIPIEKAVKFLNKKFDDIPSVEMWARGMGYSYQAFWKKFVTHFEEKPETVLIRKKKMVLIVFFKENRDCSCSRAAKKIHLQDGNGLWQFVKREFGCTPTELKNRVREKTRK